jgi:hypothetical protein
MNRSICQIPAPELISIVRQTVLRCCQSLLLDPDATMDNDLHKWLFLLVSGRGE